MVSFRAVRWWIVMTLMVPAPAWAFGVAQGPGTWRVDRTEVLIAKDGAATTVTARFRATTNARPTRLVIPLPATAALESVKLVEGLEGLDAATAPRFVVRAAPDPCESASEVSVEAWRFSHEAAPLAAKHSVKAVDAGGLAKLGLKPVGEATRYAVLEITPKKAQRARWTRAVQWRFQGDAPLAVEQLEVWTPPGREHRLTLYTAGASLLAPRGPVEPLGTPAPIAEVAFETPRDTAEAIVRHALRRAEDTGWVRTHADHVDANATLGVGDKAVVARFEGLVKKGTPPLSLASTTFIQAQDSGWIIRRKWRGGDKCITPRWVNGVRIEQTSELRAYATLSGRPLTNIRQRSLERGYELTPKGTLKKVNVKTPDGGVRVEP